MAGTGLSFTQQNHILGLIDSVAMEVLKYHRNDCVTWQIAKNAYAKYIGQVAPGTGTKTGDSIRIKLPYRGKITKGTNVLTADSVAPFVDRYTNFQVKTQDHFALQYTMREQQMDLSHLPEYIMNNITEMGQAYDQYCLEKLNDVNWMLGAPGTRIANTDVFNTAGALLSTLAVPDMGRKLIIGPYTQSELANWMTARNEGSDNPERWAAKSYRGMLADLPVLVSNHLPMYVTGSAPKAGWTVAAVTVATTGTKIKLKNATAITATPQTFKRGQRFTIAGIYATNPQTRTVSSGILQQFVVKKDAVVASESGGIAVTLDIGPELNSGDLEQVNDDGETVSLATYQNINEAVAVNDAVTLIGDSDSMYEQSFLVDSETLAWADKRLPKPASLEMATSKTDPTSGVSVLCTYVFDQTYTSETLKVETHYDAKVIDPRGAVAFIGKKLA